MSHSQQCCVFVLFQSAEFEQLEMERVPLAENIFVKPLKKNFLSWFEIPVVLVP